LRPVHHGKGHSHGESHNQGPSGPFLLWQPNSLEIAGFDDLSHAGPSDAPKVPDFLFESAFHDKLDVQVFFLARADRIENKISEAIARVRIAYRHIVLTVLIGGDPRGIISHDHVSADIGEHQRFCVPVWTKAPPITAFILKSIRQRRLGVGS
jgi:hypothetical protein